MAANTLRQVPGPGNGNKLDPRDPDRLPDTLIYSYAAGSDKAGVYFEQGKAVGAGYNGEFLFSKRKVP